MTNALTNFPPTRTEALTRLQTFLPHSGRDYAARRNYDLGAGQHRGVSGLSPYLRTRLLTEQEVLTAVLGRFSLSSAEKFIQEVFWRTYWKGWLELRPGIWETYQTNLSGAWNDVQTQSGLRREWEAACLGHTGIDCFDHWAQELANTGYLHNHARMWFASIWVFTLRLPWTLGADFFLRHLLDGDPASNTLSWRWIAGLQTEGKTYLARPDNIRKYTEGRFDPKGLASHATALPAHPKPSPRALPYAEQPAPDLRSGLLMHPDDLAPLPAALANKVPTITAHAILRVEDRLSPLTLAPHIGAFLDGACSDVQSRLAPDADWATLTSAEALLGWVEMHGLQQVILPYAPVGPVADTLAEVKARTDVSFVQIRRAYDDAAWPHATHGFFRFKDKIPTLIAQMTSASFAAA